MQCIALWAALILGLRLAPACAEVPTTLAAAGATVLADRAPALREELPALLEAASAPVNTPARREARDRLFHELVPQLGAIGKPTSTRDEAAMLSALGCFPCAGGALRVSSARVLDEAATVNIAGRSGGCSVLMRRDGDAWAFVMALGWTLSS